MLLKHNLLNFYQVYYIVLFIIFLSIFYIFQVCRITQESYLILSYQEQINELSAKNENLEINLSQNNSLKIIDELIEEMDYEKIGQIHYIKILESSVAAK